MKYLLLFTTMLFAGELEVDGDLKVTGTVDASGNPITNVGAPLLSTDAVNAGTLASVLSDDGNYEYKSIFVQWDWSGNSFISYYKLIGSSSWTSDWDGYLNNLSLNGWNILQVIPNIYTSSNIHAVVIIRKKLDD